MNRYFTQIQKPHSLGSFFFDPCCVCRREPHRKENGDEGRPNCVVDRTVNEERRGSCRLQYSLRGARRRLKSKPVHPCGVPTASAVSLKGSRLPENWRILKCSYELTPRNEVRAGFKPALKGINKKNEFLLNRFLESAAGFELRCLRCRDLYGLTGPGISSRPGLTFGH